MLWHCAHSFVAAAQLTPPKHGKQNIFLQRAQVGYGEATMETGCEAPHFSQRSIGWAIMLTTDAPMRQAGSEPVMIEFGST
jgi:hypothetical protein